MHINFDPTSAASPTISFEDFLKVDIRIGTIINCQDFPEAKKASYKVEIDFGVGIGIKKSSAQITSIYSKEDLTGKKVMAVVNFPPRQIGKFMSEVLILGFDNDKNEVVLMNPDFDLRMGPGFIKENMGMIKILKL